MNSTVNGFRGAVPSNIQIYRKGTALPHIRRHSRGRIEEFSFRQNRRNQFSLSTAHGTLLTFLVFLLTAYCLLPTALASGSWTRQRTSSLAWLHSVFFLDQNRGWAVGSR